MREITKFQGHRTKAVLQTASLAATRTLTVSEVYLYPSHHRHPTLAPYSGDSADEQEVLNLICKFWFFIMMPRDLLFDFGGMTRSQFSAWPAFRL